MEGQNPDDVNHSAPNINDVLEVLAEDEAASSGMGPAIQQTGYHSPHSPSSITPYIQIIEQPAPKETRFRYKCEGRSAGSIPGTSSSPDNKTHPTIQILGYRGNAVVVVSCVTKDVPYRPHPHNLVGKDCKRGVCSVELSPDNMAMSFTNLGIQCVKRKDVEEALRERESIRVDPFRTGFTHVNQPSNIDLNTVRLCFQAFIEDPVKKKLVPLQPVVSDTIHDKKAVQDLTICKLSQCSGSAAGGTDIILLCEKVVKEDISVRFFEERDGQPYWEGYADFTPSQVHKQVAISFKTPKYATLQIDHPVKVFIELKRPSDGATSEHRPFTIYPVESEPERWERKRKKPNPLYEETFNQSQDNEHFRAVHNDATLMVKREPFEAVPLPAGLYAGGSVSGAGVASLTYNSRSPSPNYPGSPLAAQQLAPLVPQIPQSSHQTPSTYHRVSVTPPTPSTYQQQQDAFRGGSSHYADYVGLAQPPRAIYVKLDSQQAQVSHSNITDPVEINTEELRRMVIEETTQNNDMSEIYNSMALNADIPSM